MIHWRRLIPWFLRAWPILALIPVGATHALALHLVWTEPGLVNKLVGMALQILGGLLILCSINENLGLFRSQSLTSAVIAWFKAFPIVRNATGSVSSVSSSTSMSSTMSASVSKVINTLEERVAEIERLLDETRNQLAQEVQALNTKVDEARAGLEKQVNETSTRLGELSKRLEHAAVGGFKFQALGVLLAVYGAITSVYA